MTGDVFVGVDIGTTFIKAVVYDDDFAVRGQHKVRTPWRQVATGGEADPEAIVAAVLSAVGEALRAADVQRVAAIGVTGMGEAGVLVDGDDRPLAPVIAWHDRRGHDQAGRLMRDVPGFIESAGRSPSHVCSVVKWRYLAENGLDLTRVRRWFALAEWVVHRMGGAPESEGSLASRTGALDVRAGVLDTAALAWVGARSEWFGQIVAAGRPSGTVVVGPDALHGCVITVAGLDGYASAVGVGADNPDVAFLSCGTSGAAIRTMRTSLDDEAMRRAAAMDFTLDRWLDGAHMVMLGATPCGLILQPLHDVLGPPAPGGDSRVGAALDPAALWRRAFDAVADGHVRLVRDIERLGSPVARVVAAGGWIAQTGLRDAIERRVGDRLTVIADENTAAHGAALMARSAISA